MLMFSSCISGKVADPSPVYAGEMQGVAVTIRASAASSITYVGSAFSKVAESSASGDFFRASPSTTYNVSSSILVAASINVKYNGPVTPTQYQVPIAFTNWANRGDVSEIGLKLAVATNEVMGAPPHQVDFQQNFGGEDSVTTIGAYATASGFITYVGAGANIINTSTTSINVPFSGSSLEGDTVIIPVFHQVGIQYPINTFMDLTKKIIGSTQNLDALERNTQLTVLRKVLTADDISTGHLTITAIGA